MSESPLRAVLASRWERFLAIERSEARENYMRRVRGLHPTFLAAVIADASMSAAHRGERHEYRSTLDGILQVIRLSVVSDAFLGQVFYRAKAATQKRRVPLLPSLLHRLAIITGQVCIGDPVVVAPGVYFPHGQVVIDGIVTVGQRVVIAPFVTIGLLTGNVGGPDIGDRVSIGTGARLLGPITVGAGAEIGANAVVITDVPPDRVAVGVPARVIGAD